MVLAPVLIINHLYVVKTKIEKKKKEYFYSQHIKVLHLDNSYSSLLFWRN